MRALAFPRSILDLYITIKLVTKQPKSFVNDLEFECFSLVFKVQLKNQQNDS